LWKLNVHLLNQITISIFFIYVLQNKLVKEKEAIDLQLHLSKENYHAKLANKKTVSCYFSVHCICKFIFLTIITNINNYYEEQILKLTKQRYEYDKNRLKSEIMDISDEQHSRFSKFQVLMNRYLLLNLLGKGGLGEVFKVLSFIKFILMSYSFLYIYWHVLLFKWLNISASFRFGWKQVCGL
jgi:hypothetical protein